MTICQTGASILGVGLGGDWFGELSSFGYPTDDVVRAEVLDEGLAIVSGLLSGEEFSFAGKHYTMKPTQFLPKPIQPRVPIWIAGTWPRPRPFRRAARFDGVVPMSANIEKDLSVDDVRAIADFIKQNRTSNAPFDLVHAGNTMGMSKREAIDVAAPFIDAGATWWNEAPLPWKTTLDDVRAHIAAGPPRAMALTSCHSEVSRAAAHLKNLETRDGIALRIDSDHARTPAPRVH